MLGRACELWLSRSLVDVPTTGFYFATGLNEGGNEEDRTITAHESTRRMRTAVGAALPSPEDCLSLAFGDFNWVDDELGRFQSGSSAPAKFKDKTEEEHWRELVI